MATSTTKNRCIICGKEKASVKCEGCSQTFCYNHVSDHRQELNKQLDEIEVTRDLFRQRLTGQTVDPQKHPLIQQINQWEQDSIRIIQQTAREAKQLINKHTTEHSTKIEIKLAKLTKQLRENRQENDFVEIDLNLWREELKRLEEEFAKPSNISIQQDSKPLVTKIFVKTSEQFNSTLINIHSNTKWKQKGITITGGNGKGDKLNQPAHPQGIYVDDDQTIYIADCWNHRIVSWKCNSKTGHVVAGGNGQENRTDQLCGPTDVILDKENDSLIICDQLNRRVVRWSRRNGTSGQAIISDIKCWGITMDKNGDLYVSDHEKNEVRRWKKGESCGTIVAGGNGKGAHLNQLNHPTFLFIDEDYSVYVSDCYNHRVMKWMQGAKEGIIVAGGKGQGKGLTQLSSPQGLIVDHLGHVYVADLGNHRVMRWCKGAKEGNIVVGGNGQGNQSNQFYRPIGLSFDRQGNLYVVEWGNHRVQKFEIDSN